MRSRWLVVFAGATLDCPSMCPIANSYWGPHCGAPAGRSPPVGAELAGVVILSESTGVPAGSEPVRVRRREFALLQRQ